MDIAFIFIIGSIVGSFLNVCIVRLPEEKSVVFPSSHCPSCKKSIAWFDNIPMISWLLLRGRCRNCKAKFSFRYCLVELLTGIVFVLFYNYFGVSPVLPAYLIMVSCFIVATFVDFSHRIIPDEISIGGMWVGIGLSALIPELHSHTEDLSLGAFLAGLIVLICLFLTWIYPFFCKHLMEEDNASDDKPLHLFVLISLIFVVIVNGHFIAWPSYLLDHVYSLACSLVGFIVGAGIIYAMGLIGDIVFRKESMGGGDVKLMAMIGAFLGWKLAILTFFIAPFFGAVVGIVEKIRTKDSTIAYGPFLVLGALASLFYGEKIIMWVLNGGFYQL